MSARDQTAHLAEQVRLIAGRTAYGSPRFSLVFERFATPDGEVERTVIHHPGAVGVIARPRAGALVLVRQYRYPIRRWTLEIPAGTCEPGEEPAHSAHRELAEEAGWRAERLVERCRFHPAVGVSDELLVIYEAEGLSRVPTAPDHGELVRPEVVALDEVPRLIAEGLVCDGKTLVALALLGAFPPEAPPC